MVFALGDPAKGMRGLGLLPFEPHALTPVEVRSLKNLCDRLPRFLQRKGQRWARDATAAPLHAHDRPWSDRAIVAVFLSTGLRPEELLTLDLDQVAPHTVAGPARADQVCERKEKGGTERTVFLSADARQALSGYLEKERPRDAGEGTRALFLSATGIPARRPDSRLSPAPST